MVKIDKQQITYVVRIIVLDDAPTGVKAWVKEGE